jgi:hypothetical protein
VVSGVPVASQGWVFDGILKVELNALKTVDNGTVHLVIIKNKLKEGSSGKVDGTLFFNSKRLFYNFNLSAVFKNTFLCITTDILVRN